MTEIKQIATTYFQNHSVLALKKLLKEREYKTTGPKAKLVQILVEDSMEYWKAKDCRDFTYYIGKFPGGLRVYIYKYGEHFDMLETRPFNAGLYTWRLSDERGHSLQSKVVRSDKLVEEIANWKSKKILNIIQSKK